MSFANKPKPGARTKKRNGTHRKQNQHYLKHYWPYLPMLAIVGIGFAVSNLLGPHQAVLGAMTGIDSNSLLVATNRQRLAHDEPTLKIDNQLNQAAATKAADMVRSDYWSHVTPTGTTPWQFITNSGYQYQLAGENLAYGFSDSATVLNAWMHSSEHRTNILNAGYSQVGFGLAQSPDYLDKGPAMIVVAMYAEPKPAGQANFTFQSSNLANDVKGAHTTASSGAVARGQLLIAGQAAAWPVGVVTLLIAIGVLYLLTNHAQAWRRRFVRGEQFVVHHLALDYAVITLVTAGVVLSHAAGFVL